MRWVCIPGTKGPTIISLKGLASGHWLCNILKISGKRSFMKDIPLLKVAGLDSVLLPACAIGLTLASLFYFGLGVVGKLTHTDSGR